MNNNKNQTFAQNAAAAFASLREATLQKILSAINANPYKLDGRVYLTEEERFSARMSECFTTYAGVAFHLAEAGRLEQRDADEAARLLDEARGRFTGWAPPADAKGQTLIESALVEYVETTRMLRAEQQDLILA